MQDSLQMMLQQPLHAFSPHVHTVGDTRSTHSSQPQTAKQNTIHVSNVPRHVPDAAILKLFGNFGEITGLMRKGFDDVKEFVVTST